MMCIFNNKLAKNMKTNYHYRLNDKMIIYASPKKCVHKKENNIYLIINHIVTMKKILI